MKKIIALLAAALTLLSAFGCACGPAGQSEASSQSSSAAISEPAYGDEEKYLAEHLPKMDGSTSLIPLEAGIRAALLGISLEDATRQVVHTTTYGSFSNLLNGSCDLIFSTPLSAAQRNEAETAGVTLTGTKIAAEGFVFVVNADNPVDTLTQQQVKDIYSGRVTNWKQLGGNDAPIIAYQRNTDSGSQNYMIDFMSDDSLMDAPTELRPASMSGLMDVIALNDNSVNAIGYSVYAYAADMYGNGNEIKFLKIDGVAPNKQTMAAGEYPLMNFNYAFYNADKYGSESDVARLVNWLASYNGQYAIAKAGYVTVMDIGFDYTEMTLNRYSALGTGTNGQIPAGEATYEYTASLGKQTEWGYESTLQLAVPSGLPTQRPEGAVSNEEYFRVYTDVGFTVSPLTDSKLTDEINAWLAAAVERSKTRYDELDRIIEGANAGQEYNTYTAMQVRSGDTVCFCYTKADVRAVNGWLCATVYTGYNYAVMDGYDRYVMVESAFFDLIGGKQVKLTDMFRKGTDIAATLNAAIPVGIQYLNSDELTPTLETKIDFAGLTRSGWALTFDGVAFGGDNPYFSAGAIVPVDFGESQAVWLQPRDMDGLFESAVIARELRQTIRRVTYHSMKDGLGSYALLDTGAGSNPEVRAKINADILSRVEKAPALAEIADYFAAKGYTITADNVGFYDWQLTEYIGRFVILGMANPTVFIDDEQTGNFIETSYPEDEAYCNFVCYDLKTGDAITLSALLKDGWQEHCTVDGEASAQTPSLAPQSIMTLVTADGYQMMINISEKDNYYSIKLDPDWFIWD